MPPFPSLPAYLSVQVDDDKSNVSGIKVTSNRSARQYMWVCTAGSNMVVTLDCCELKKLDMCLFLLGGNDVKLCYAVVRLCLWTHYDATCMNTVFNVCILELSVFPPPWGCRNRRGGFNRPLPTEKTGEKVARD